MTELTVVSCLTFYDNETFFPLKDCSFWHFFWAGFESSTGRTIAFAVMVSLKDSLLLLYYLTYTLNPCSKSYALVVTFLML